MNLRVKRYVFSMHIPQTEPGHIRNGTEDTLPLCHIVNEDIMRRVHGSSIARTRQRRSGMDAQHMWMRRLTARNGGRHKLI